MGRITFGRDAKASGCTILPVRRFVFSLTMVDLAIYIFLFMYLFIYLSIYLFVWLFFIYFNNLFLFPTSLCGVLVFRLDPAGAPLLRLLRRLLLAHSLTHSLYR